MKKLLISLILGITIICSIFAGSLDISFNTEIVSFKQKHYVLDSATSYKVEKNPLCSATFAGINVGYSGKITNNLNIFGEFGYMPGSQCSFMSFLGAGFSFVPKTEKLGFEFGIGPEFRFSWYNNPLYGVGIFGRLQLNVPVYNNISLLLNLSPSYICKTFGNKHDDGAYSYFEEHGKFCMGAKLGLKFDL